MRQGLNLESRERIILPKEGGAFDLHRFKRFTYPYLRTETMEKRLTRNIEFFAPRRSFQL